MLAISTNEPLCVLAVLSTRYVHISVDNIRAFPSIQSTHILCNIYSVCMNEHISGAIITARTAALEAWLSLIPIHLYVEREASLTDLPITHYRNEVSNRAKCIGFCKYYILRQHSNYFKNLPCHILYLNSNQYLEWYRSIVAK